MNAKTRLLFTALCMAGLLAVMLAGVANVIAYRQATRGIVQGFPPPVAHADVPRLGVNVAIENCPAATLRQTLAPLFDGELKWIRQTFPWAQIEPEPGRFEWDKWDAVFAKLEQCCGNVKVLAVLDAPPAWFEFPLSVPRSTFHFPLSTNAFTRFAGEFARRYGDRIDYYQIWDEPNLGANWGGQVEVAAYADMLKQAGDAIRAADPGAVIVLAGLAPTVEQSSRNMADWLFLRRLYEIGARDYFDVVAGKPYGFETGPADRRVDAAVLNFSHILLMREEMEHFGDAAKPLWATQWGWNALPADWTGAPNIWGQNAHLTEAHQAEYIAQAVRRAGREWPWMTAMFLENFQPADPSTTNPRWGFALVWQDGAPRPAYTTLLELAREASWRRAAYYPAAVRAGQGYIGNPAAAFHGQWRFGELGADWQDESGAQVSFCFEGTGLALHVRRAADRAHLYVIIDGQGANALPHDGKGAFLQLIPPDFTQADVALVPVARGLAPARHCAEIVAERGWNQWAFIGWSVENRPSAFSVWLSALALGVLGLACLAGAIWNGRKVEWGRVERVVRAGYARLSDAAQIALTLLAGGLMYLGAWMTWGQGAAAVFRRLGDGGGLLAMLGVSALFYFSPWLILTLLSGLALFALILLRLDWGLALVVLFAPFFFLPRPLFERVFSMAEIVTLMCFVSWLKVESRRWKVEGQAHLPLSTGHWPLSTLDYSVLAFVAVSVASLLVAEYRHVAVRELRVIVLEPALLYLMLRTTLKNRADVWRIVDALALAGGLVAIIGLVQYAFNLNIITAEEGVRRLRAVYGSPNNAALFLGRVLPLLVAVTLIGQGRRRALYALAIAPVALAILFTFSKGALLLGAPASLAMVLLVWQGRRAWKWLVGLATAGAAALAALMQLPQIGARLDLSGGTTVFRINLWTSALMMIREHPLLGVGLDNFLYAYRGRYLLPQAWAESSLSHPHNVVLDYAARLGLLGLASGVWLQIAFWKTAWPLRRLEDPLNRALAIGLMGSMTAFLAHGLVDASFFVVDLAYVFFVTLAVVQCLYTGPNHAKIASGDQSTICQPLLSRPS